MSHRCNRHFWNRRDFLFRSGGGISGLALAYLLDRESLLFADATTGSDVSACTAAATGVNPYAPKPAHFRPRATLLHQLRPLGHRSLALFKEATIAVHGQQRNQRLNRFGCVTRQAGMPYACASLT